MEKVATFTHPNIILHFNWLIHIFDFTPTFKKLAYHRIQMYHPENSVQHSEAL